MRSSGAAASTCVFGAMNTSATSPENGAVTIVSIFMLSSTTIGSPAATRSPGLTSTEMTNAGHPARTTPPSSRTIR
jgi:hypothetical protein